MSKLTALHINIIGAVVALILSVALYFVLIKPKNEQLVVTQADIESTKSAGGTEEAVKAAARDLQNTKLAAKKTERDWAVNEKRYMPTLAFGKTQQPLNLYQYAAYVDPSGEHFGLRDMPRLWGTWLEAWYATQKPGVKFVSADDKTSIGIPGYPVDPNAISGLKAITFPESGKTWKINVLCTSFEAAMAHLKRVNLIQNHGMPVVNNVSLSGHSPALSLIYDFGLYVIPHTDPPPVDPLIAPADPNAAAGAPGVFGAGG